MIARRFACAGVLVALALSSSTTARAADPDPWLGKDKALHFGISAGIAGVTYAAGTTIFEARGHALLLAGGVTLAIGAGKELLDLTGFGDPSWKDFAADAAGTIVGLAVAWSIDLAVRGTGTDHPLFVEPRSATRPAGLAFRF